MRTLRVRTIMLRKSWFKEGVAPMVDTTGDIRRAKLFDVLSANLQFVKKDPRVHLEPNIEEGVICPLCFKLFTRESLSREFDDHLTLEDVPPSSLGGKPRTLTCKICNNWAGTELEADLANKLRSDEVLKGLSAGRIETRFMPGEGIDLAARSSITSERIIVRYDPERSDPSQIEKLHRLEESGEIGEITLKFLLRYRINRPEIALIRIAYLMAFSRFGYGFLMNANLLPVRSQIQRSDKTILPDWGILPGNLPDEALGVNIIYSPQELQSYLVVFDLRTANSTTRYGVVLPGPSYPGSNIYFELAKLRSAKEPVTVTYSIRGIPDDSYVSREELAFASHHYWEASRS